MACFWAFWGIIENFHEGWYFDSTWSNLAPMFGQYLSFMLGFIAAEHDRPLPRVSHDAVTPHPKTRCGK